MGNILPLPTQRRPRVCAGCGGHYNEVETDHLCPACTALAAAISHTERAAAVFRALREKAS